MLAPTGCTQAAPGCTDGRREPCPLARWDRRRHAHARAGRRGERWL